MCSRLPGCNSIRRRPAWAEPEVVFRIVHVALAAGSPPAAYRDQTVEVALGPNAAFQGGNTGTLMRRVPASRVVTGVASRRGKPRPPREPKTPRVVELLRKAIEWRRQLDAGEIPNRRKPTVCSTIQSASRRTKVIKKL